MLPPKLVDMRKDAGRDKVYGSRSWKKVTGICLHQTACVLGERPGRWANTGCHVGITRTGQIIWLHDFDRKVVHGNGFNTQTIGIEIDGLYAGVEGDPKTVWDNPDTSTHEAGQSLTQATVDSARAAIGWMVATVHLNGGDIRALVAHRQASDTRRNDPGSAIWQRIAMPSMLDYQLSDGGDGFKIGDGYPIPKAWDSRRTAAY